MLARRRVLVVDDAVVVRRLVTDVLSADPALQVVGTAANGRIALAKIPLLRPDLVILDVEMPDMDGLATLSILRRHHPRLPVIMFSTLTERGAATTLEALAAGANDYVTKPTGTGSAQAAMAHVAATLVPRVKALCGLADPPPPGARRPAPPVPGRRGPSSMRRPVGVPEPHRIDIVAVGVSTGGPHALSVLLQALPCDFPVPIVVAQHMPALFTRLLAERLDAQAPLAVAEAVAGQALRPGHVWIAPGGSHLVVRREATGVRLGLEDGPPVNSCRPAVDVLFRSVADVYGRRVLAAVLTGMGSDGLRGSEHVLDCGGTVLAQDRASSVVWGMPGAVVGAGLADWVGPLPRLAAELARRAEVGRAAPLASAGGRP